MLSAHKLVLPALRALLTDSEVRVDGFILPGHVAVVIGMSVFSFVADAFHVPGVVTGFEPLEILRSVCRLMLAKEANTARIENEYESVVRSEGSPEARRILAMVYEPVDANWRGIGVIPQSGLKMREEFAAFDIEQLHPIETAAGHVKSGCRCGDVLRGIIQPPACPLFGRVCEPTHAVGPCMVSVEGVCAAWYKYGRGRFTYGA